QVGQLGLTPDEHGNFVQTHSYSEIPGNNPKQVQRITVEANGTVLWGYQTTYFHNTYDPLQAIRSAPLTWLVESEPQQLVAPFVSELA
ncbi:MAG: hypothetical protein ACK5Q5_03540, partial [Planctomycetaceae bacterium]